MKETNQLKELYADLFPHGIRYEIKQLFPMGLWFEFYRIENTTKIKEIIDLYGDMILNKFYQAINYMFWSIVCLMILAFGLTTTLIILWRMTI